MPAQPTIGADQRSALARQPGVPWWGATLIAVTMTLAGTGIEAALGHQELGSAFAIFYSLGCVLAVLAVRRSGLFTALIQPPLLLFVAVPLAYYLFHNSSFSGVKEIAITCGYPLIERFPLMMFTTATVLLIGLVRWYLASSRPDGRTAAPEHASQGAGLLAGLSMKLSAAFAGNGSVDERPGHRASRPRHASERPTSAQRPRRAQERAGDRSRRPRPTDEPRQRREDTEPRRRRAETQPRRRRDETRNRDTQWGTEPPRRRVDTPRDPQRGSPPPPRREERDRRDYREPAARDYREPAARDYREPAARDYREPAARDYREPAAPQPARASRYEPYESTPGRRYRSHQAYPGDTPHPAQDRRQAPRRRPAPSEPVQTHHPVSRVRYRDSGPGDADFRSR
jgi:hypothetical protein